MSSKANTYYVTIAVTLTEEAPFVEACNIINEVDYSLSHPRVKDTEIVEINERL
jgi:hypothetical protein